jgi:saccharopine dehydrogenase-like NADP-dependent oxidoreductase
VLLMPRWIDAQRVTFKYGLGNEFIEVLKTLRKIGLDKTAPVPVKGSLAGGSESLVVAGGSGGVVPPGNVTVLVSPRDLVAACLPDPANLGEAMSGATCAGVWVTGTGKDGQPREVYLYHVVDNADSMREYGAQCVVWQTAVNPVVALELLASGVWSGVGVLGPEAFDAEPFLELLAGAYESPWGLQER